MLLKSQVSFFKRTHSYGMCEYLVWLVRLLNKTKQKKIGTKKKSKLHLYIPIIK